jgi:WhiB family redox-sensing transcriptional regulator
MIEATEIGDKGGGRLRGRAVIGQGRIRSDWRASAACRGVPTSVFFPEQGSYVAEAFAICGRCEVRRQCEEEAIRSGFEGVWGGTTELQRRSIKRRQRRRAS